MGLTSKLQAAQAADGTVLTMSVDAGAPKLSTGAEALAPAGAPMQQQLQLGDAAPCHDATS
jgi:hypothetical protein